jgi:hypothetical protein
MQHVQVRPLSAEWPGTKLLNTVDQPRTLVAVLISSFSLSLSVQTADVSKIPLAYLSRRSRRERYANGMLTVPFFLFMRALQNALNIAAALTQEEF